MGQYNNDVLDIINHLKDLAMLEARPSRLNQSEYKTVLNHCADIVNNMSYEELFDKTRCEHLGLARLQLFAVLILKYVKINVYEDYKTLFAWYLMDNEVNVDLRSNLPDNITSYPKLSIL